MAFLKSECEERGATVVCATHIFDGLNAWATHLALLSRGELSLARTAEVPGLADVHGGRLFSYVEGWLRAEAAAAPGVERAERVQVMNNGWASGRLTSTVAKR